MKRLHWMTKAELIQTMLNEIPPGNRRSALEEARTVRIMGVFFGPCHSREFITIRAVDFHTGQRRVTYYAIGEWPLTSGMGMTRRCGKVDPPDWTKLSRKTNSPDYSDVAILCVDRLIERWRKRNERHCRPQR